VGLLQEQKSNCQLDLESGTNTDPERPVSHTRRYCSSSLIVVLTPIYSSLQELAISMPGFFTD